MKGKAIGILIGLSIIVLAVYAFIKRREYIEAEKAAKAYPIVLKRTTTQEGKIADKEVFLGKFEPKDEASISSRVSAYILYVAKEGTKVKKGDLLVKLDNSNIVANINALRNNQQALSFQQQSLKKNLGALMVKYQNQKKIFQRDKVLYENRAISEEAFEKSQDLYQEAKAQYESTIKQIEGLSQSIAAVGNQAKSLEDDLKYTNIVAPFDGVVSKRYLKEGDLAIPGKPIVDLEGTNGGYEIYVDIPESLLKYVKAGDEETIKLNGKIQKAIVETIIPKAQNNMVTIKLYTNSNNINAVPDMYIKTYLTKGFCEGTLIPNDAVNHTSKGYFALEIVDNRVHWVKFTPKARNSKYFCTKDIPPNVELGLANRSEMLSIQEGEKIEVYK
ncbi:MAG TPA: HlyD family efflux transporter periplasmic adaptor subunit [Hydrogenobaculum sp.]|nr:HlyD family efflux transporter periplasmic adaptor subunit [Hydrogenobaculum sp.]